MPWLRPEDADGLSTAIDRLARAARLLVSCDFDGTLASMVDDPADATPAPGAEPALRALASLRETHVSIVSGRARENLAAVSGSPEGVLLVGSHGAEVDASDGDRLPSEAKASRTRLVAEVAALVRDHTGARLELKPAGVAVHTRGMGGKPTERVMHAIRTRPARRTGVYALDGKDVLDLSVVPLDKGAFLWRLGRAFGASSVLYVGDDVTDELAFARLTDRDVGIKVGPGETLASFRVGGPPDVIGVLTDLHERRLRYL